MRSKVIFPLLGFILFGFCSHVEKVYSIEILNNFILQIATFIAKIISFVLISFLLYNRLGEIKKPEKYPLLLVLISLLWLTHKIYVGYSIINLALQLFVLNLIILLLTFSKVQKNTIVFSLIGIVLIGIIFAISTQTEHITLPKATRF